MKVDGHGKPIDQSEFNRGFQGVLRVLKIRPRPFYNTRHTYISVALTEGSKDKWVAEYTRTSSAMIHKHYGKYIRDDGDAPLRAYVERRKLAKTEPKTGTFPGTSSRSDYDDVVKNLASQSFPSWNQLVTWLKELEVLRQENAA